MRVFLFLFSLSAFAQTPPPVIRKTCTAGDFVNAINGSSATCSTPPSASNSDSIPEGSTNLYYTNARSRGAISGTAPISYNSTTGVISCVVATGSVAGCLGAADFVTLMAKQAAITTGTTSQYFKGDLSLGTFQTDVRAQISATAPIAFSAGAISCAVATDSIPGCMSAADHTSLTGKQAAITTGTTSQYFKGDLSLGTFQTDVRAQISATAPIAFSAGAISCAVATDSIPGCMSAADHTSLTGKGTGSVTSVAASVPSVFSISGSPVTTSGTLAMTYSGTALPSLNGGTGVTDITTDWLTQYGILAGRSGGQTLKGDTASGGNLTLMSTAHATKGKLLFGTSAYDEVNNRLGINLTAPGVALETKPTSDATAGNLRFTSANGSNQFSMGVSNGGTFYMINQMSGSHAVFAVTGSQDIICIGGCAQNAMLAVHPGGATPTSYPTMTVEAGSSQTADLMDFHGTAGTKLLSVNVSGVIVSASANESTGAGSALLGTNSPATTNTAPYTWIKFKTSDGSTVYMPAWK